MNSVQTLFGESSPRRGIGMHQNASSGQDEWLTPLNVIDALGPFDLDPCAPIHRPWPTATKHYTAHDDGLTKSWHGLVWLNPPYSNAGLWMAKMARHGNGIALLPARTETATFHSHVWPHASVLLFLKGRLSFCYVNGRCSKQNSGAPSVLIGYGSLGAQRVRHSGLVGALVTTDATGDVA